VKICLVCSHGGHLTETLQILDAFDEHQVFFATYHSTREAEVRQMAPGSYFTDNIGASVWRMVRAFGWSFSILRRERPEVILSLGAEIALPFFYWGKLLGIKTIFIESWCRVEDLSLTGRLVYPVADAFWVQWPQLIKVCGPKAQYRGAVI
jgi:UDP-N-acetylglucosamine:LPS N-acetylglucosamine transferase